MNSVVHRVKLRERGFNVAPTEEERLDEIKEAYVQDLITVEEMEEAVQFVLEGGYFAGSFITTLEDRR